MRCARGAVTRKPNYCASTSARLSMRNLRRSQLRLRGRTPHGINTGAPLGAAAYDDGQERRGRRRVMELTTTTILVAFAGVFLICFMRGAFGGGFGIVGIPVLSLVMDPVTAGGLLAPL